MWLGAARSHRGLLDGPAEASLSMWTDHWSLEPDSIASINTRDDSSREKPGTWPGEDCLTVS